MLYSMRDVGWNSLRDIASFYEASNTRKGNTAKKEAAWFLTALLDFIAAEVPRGGIPRAYCSIAKLAAITETQRPKVEELLGLMVNAGLASVTKHDVHGAPYVDICLKGSMEIPFEEWDRKKKALRRITPGEVQAQTETKSEVPTLTHKIENEQPEADRSEQNSAPAFDAGEDSTIVVYSNYDGCEKLTARRFAERELPPAEMLFRIKGGGLWMPSPEQLAEWRECYRRINFDVEAEKARLWLKSNPQQLKSAKGMPRFLVNWCNSSHGKLPVVQPVKYSAPGDDI